MSERRLPDKPGWWWFKNSNGYIGIAEVNVLEKETEDSSWSENDQWYITISGEADDFDLDLGPDREWVGPVNPEPLPWPGPSIDPISNLPTKAGYYYYEGVDGSRRVSFVSNDNPEQLMALSEGLSDIMIPVDSPVFARWIGRIEKY